MGRCIVRYSSIPIRNPIGSTESASHRPTHRTHKQSITDKFLLSRIGMGMAAVFIYILLWFTIAPPFSFIFEAEPEMDAHGTEWIVEGQYCGGGIYFQYIMVFVRVLWSLVFVCYPLRRDRYHPRSANLSTLRHQSTQLQHLLCSSV